MIPVQPVCVPQATGSAPGVRLLAQPVSAPPSGDNEPPRAKLQVSTQNKKPQVRDSKEYDAYPVAHGDKTKATDGRCKVNFWNVSGKSLVLQVGGRRLSLASGRSVTLELDRQFAWQIEGRVEHSQSIPQAESELDILIRRR